MKRTPLKRKTPLRSKTKLKQVSDKMKVKLREYAKVRKEHLEANPRCVRCGNLATEIHHSNHREGKRLTDKEHFISTCAHCHRFIHDNPSLSRSMGWLK